MLASLSMTMLNKISPEISIVADHSVLKKQKVNSNDHLG